MGSYDSVICFLKSCLGDGGQGETRRVIGVQSLCWDDGKVLGLHSGDVFNTTECTLTNC